MTNLMYDPVRRQERLWEFFEYVTENGRKVISDWVKKDIEKKAEIRFHVTLQYLSVSEKALWIRPEYSPLGSEISEIRFDSNKLEHRVFGFFLSDINHFVMVVGATKKGKTYKPADAINTAKQRKKEIVSQRGRLNEYTDYDIKAI
jgi:phage-related protein